MLQENFIFFLELVVTFQELVRKMLMSCLGTHVVLIKVFFKLHGMKFCDVLDDFVNFGDHDYDIFPALLQIFKGLWTDGGIVTWFICLKFFLLKLIKLFLECCRVDIDRSGELVIKIDHHLVNQKLDFSLERLLGLILKV